MAPTTHRTVGVEAEAFLAAIRRRGKAEATLKSYGKSLRYFAQWAEDRDLSSITADQIENDYLPWWERQFELDKIERFGLERGAGRTPAQNSLRVHLNALGSFYDWLERFDRVDRNPMRRVERVKAAKRRNDWLTADEDEAMLRSCRSPQQRICLYLLRFTGMRVGEAVALRNRDIHLHQTSGVGEIVVATSKTADGLRRIPILPELRPALLEWRQYQLRRGFHQPQDWLLSTRTRKPMYPYQVEKCVKIVAHRAGVRPWPADAKKGYENLSQVSPHTLRRTFGSHLLNHGVRIEVVSALLGHADVRVTQQAYAELLQATIAREVLAFV